ncbi:F510_1955 family glycosylhydrolase [Agrococcus sp. HG114]|uniref:F510_1955 family glycosylhydrolase n=1 Tax=Agrococcus sp. HG114 TaxID=2969757 RepID=UPI00215A108D|nr:sialidase family protein [Agrococcus sp. HG114]MCR8670231.1 glycoside hydrolase [Agrococcus sp. HG114]
MTAPRSSMLLILSAFALALSGCAQAPASSPGGPAAPPQADALSHVHGIGTVEGDAAVLLATHTGVYRVDAAGSTSGPLGGNDFDAMGFTVVDDALLASGHPGPTTPAELGSPNLGIIRSDDGGLTWRPVSQTGVEDFHVLTAAPDGTLYGVGSTAPNVRSSPDGGSTWSAGAALPVADLATGANGALYAATEDGLQVSTDGGGSFSLVPDAPLLFQIAGSADGMLIGAGTDGLLWRSLPGGGWESGEPFQGRLQALAAGEGTDVLLVDDRGLVRVGDGGASVILPAG